jgi:hypothetical protein
MYFLRQATPEGHVLVYDISQFVETPHFDFRPSRMFPFFQLFLFEINGRGFLVKFVDILSSRVSSLSFAPSSDELVVGCWDDSVHFFRYL